MTAVFSSVSSLVMNATVLPPDGSMLDGYYFADSQMMPVSFFANSEMTAAYDMRTEIYNDMILFAGSTFDLYVSLTYSVGGLEIATELLSYNAVLSDLRTVEREGYIFGGWYYDELFTRPVEAGDKITSNTMIYAKLTEPKDLSFMQKIGDWLTSRVGIIVICGGGTLLIIGGVGYAVKKKK